jgi:hypothetical protein
MTETVRFFELGKRVLVTRESARALEGDLRRAVFTGGEVVLDFSGVDGITPSFLDETLGLIQGAFAAARPRGLVVRVLRPPTRLSAKFEAVGRSRGLSIREHDGSEWVIEPVQESA